MTLLESVKASLSIKGDYHDETLGIYIDATKDYLKAAGVSEETIDSSKALGVICRGTADLWVGIGGESRFSEYFKERAIQLAMEEGVQNV